METCIVYLRKSTNRGDKQQLTLDMQAKWIRKVLLENPTYRVIWFDWKIQEISEEWFIYESESAIQWWKTRPLFKKMVDTINEYGCDYLIVSRPNRISRNSDDMGTFMKLFEWSDKKIRKAIITETSRYDVNDKKQVHDLEIALLNAKTDNVNRSIDAKDSQNFRISNWIYPFKLPFWYKATKTNAGIEIDTEKMLLVELAFNWRLEWCSWKKIADHFEKEWHKIKWETIKNIVSNSFYTWRFEDKTTWKLIAIKNDWFKVMIDKPLFDKVQEYNKNNAKKHWTSNINSKWDNIRHLDKMVFDILWKALQPYKNTKTWKIYYRQSTKDSNYKITISESKLFTEIEKNIDKYKFTDEIIVIIKEVLYWKMNSVKINSEAELRNINSEIYSNENNIKKATKKLILTDKENIADIIEEEITNLQDERKILDVELDVLKENTVNTKELVEKYSKIFEELPNTFRKAPKNEKADILRGLWISFMVWPDKSISIQWWKVENIFKSLTI